MDALLSEKKGHFDPPLRATSVSDHAKFIPVSPR